MDTKKTEVVEYNKETVKNTSAYLRDVLIDKGLDLGCIVDKLQNMLLVGNASDQRFAMSAILGVHLKYEDTLTRAKEKARDRAFELKKHKLSKDIGLKIEAMSHTDEFKKAEHEMNLATAELN